MSRKIYLGLSLVLLAGCADNPYAKTYQPSSEIVLRSAAQRREQPIPNTPELVKGTDPNKRLGRLVFGRLRRHRAIQNQRLHSERS